MGDFNVLVLTNRGADCGATYLFNGLCQTLGARRAYDFPIKKAYHGGIDMVPWGNGKTVIPVSSYAWMPSHVCGEQYGPNPFDVTENAQFQIVSAMLRRGNISLVILESTRIGPVAAYKQLARDIEVSGAPVIIHDGEDSWGLTGPTLKLIKETVNPDVVLKREFPVESDLQQIAGVPVLPFPFSAPSAALATNFGEHRDSAVDVSMLLGVTHPSRAKVAEVLRVFDEEYNTYIACHMSEHPRNKEWMGWQEYICLLARSRVGVSVRGAGYDTCRYWETAATTCLVADELKIVIPHGFADGESCVLYRSPEECADKVRMLLKDPNLADRIWGCGRNLVVAHHTNGARVKDLLSTLREMKVVDAGVTA